VYCFDTDVVVAALHGEPPLPLVRRLARTPAPEQCTTSVTVAEIAYAAARSGNGDVMPRFHELIAAAQTVLPFDDEAALAYGALRAHLEGLGRRLDESSLRIASIVLARDLILVTGSARLYDRVPDLRIENWLEPDELARDHGLDAPEKEETADEPARHATDGVVRHPGAVASLEGRRAPRLDDAESGEVEQG
jgi:tRNA(fMet)-specific endonuclease VapC